MTNKNYNRSFLRIAGISGLITAILIFFVLIFVTNISVSSSIITALCMFGITFLCVFITNRMLLVKHLKVVDRITKDISKKRFEAYQQVDELTKNDINQLVSQSKKASNTMRREITRLNKIENYRKEFIGDISHELKTPIFAVQGFIETLLDGAIDDETVNRDFLEKALKNVDRLNHLTKDLMEISRLETGELKSNRSDFNLYDLIHEVVETLQYKAEEEGVLIQIQDNNQNIIVNADRHQLKQVFINLIENGVKYNKIGGLVTVDIKDYSTNKSLVTIKDTGIGIEKEYLERITERFFRIDKSRSRQKGGTGLGLAIVKHIIEAHDEQFFIESTPKKGSVFSFTLTKNSMNDKAL